MRRIALLALLFPLALLFLPSCGDDDNPVNGGGNEEITPRGGATPESIVILLQHVYNGKDSTDYADLLDSSYVFALDSNNINPDGWTDSTWGKKTECVIVANMLEGRVTGRRSTASPCSCPISPRG